MNCRAWSWKLIVGTMAIFGGAASGQAQLRPLAEVPTFPKPSQTLEISSPPPTASAQPTFTLNWYAAPVAIAQIDSVRDATRRHTLPYLLIGAIGGAVVGYAVGASGVFDSKDDACETDPMCGSDDTLFMLMGSGLGAFIGLTIGLSTAPD